MRRLLIALKFARFLWQNRETLGKIITVVRDRKRLADDPAPPRV